MKIIHNLPASRWQEYKDLRIQAVKDVPQAFLDDLATTEKEPKKEWLVKAKNMIFAELDGQLVGMIGLVRRDHQKNKHIMKLVSFYVLSEYRGKGVGRKLMETALEDISKIPGLHKVSLGVTTTQQSAYRLYLSFGFKKVGVFTDSIKVGSRYYDQCAMEMILE